MSAESKFRVYRDSAVGENSCSFDDVMDFLDACGLKPLESEAQIAAILAGVPLEVDGSTVRFKLIE